MMSASTRYVLTSLVAFSWLAAGCSSPTKIDLGGGCLVNSDCNSPLSCSFGKCHAVCVETRDCPLGQSCVAAAGGSVCQLPVEAKCRTATCAIGTVCAVDYRCRTVCQSPTNCTPGQACVSNVCADGTDLDPSGQLPQTVPPKVDSGVDVCPTGSETCACYGNDTCNAGLACASHLCVRLPGGDAGGGGGTGGAGGVPGTGGSSGSPADARPGPEAGPDATPDLGDVPAEQGSIAPSAPGTVALFHFNGPNGSTTLTDSSGKGKVAVITGNPVISTAQSKFGGASLYVNGTATVRRNFVSVPEDADLNFPGDFTIDWWQYVVAYTNTWGGFVQVRAQAESDKNTCAYCVASGWSAGGASYQFIRYPDDAVAAPTAKAWHHLALTRSGDAFRVFIDGKLVATDAGFSVTVHGILSTTGQVVAGDNGDFNGYIDELRVVKGVALWTTDFAPPTSEYAEGTAVAEPAPELAPEIPDAAFETGGETGTSLNTVALFHFDGTQGSTNLPDSSGTGKVAVITGNPVISTAQSKFGGASLYVNGGSVRGVDYVAVATAGSDFSMDGDFTIDWWQDAVTATNSFANIVNLFQNASDAVGCSIRGGGSGVHFNPYYPGSIVTTKLFNAWHHIAITRAGTTYRAFIDGQVVYTNPSSVGTVGGSPLGVSNPTPGPGDNGDFNGYIDELRVVKGAAVWTSDFTPPSAPY
jgi:hypothetical protein